MSNELYLAFLATTFIVFLCAMLTPVVLVATRPIHPACQRLAWRAAWAGCKAAVVRWFLAFATAGMALTMVVAVFASPVQAQSPHDVAQKATTSSIERMIAVLEKAAKHPVVVGAQVLSRGFMAVRVYRLTKEVKGIKIDIAALNTLVHAILIEVTGVIERIEASEEMTAAKLDAVNARIDVHAVRIAAAEAEIELLKLRVDQADHERRALERDQREIERQQEELKRKQRALAQQQREADERQQEIDARLAAQQKRMSRPSNTPNVYFDPKCQCRRDKRDLDKGNGQPSAVAAKQY